MSIRWIFPVFIAALVCGCTSLVIDPRDNALVSGADARVPVTIQLSWPSGGLGMGPIVEVDGQSGERELQEGATLHSEPLREGGRSIQQDYYR